MKLNHNNRTEMIKARVSEEEKNLIKVKAEYYGYKQLSIYIRDATIYKKVTFVDLVGKNEILEAYSDNTKILKEMNKSIKHIAIFATQIEKYERKDLRFKMVGILKHQMEMIKLIDRKLDLDAWQKVNHRKLNKRADIFNWVLVNLYLEVVEVEN